MRRKEKNCGGAAHAETRLCRSQNSMHWARGEYSIMEDIPTRKSSSTNGKRSWEEGSAENILTPKDVENGGAFWGNETCMAQNTFTMFTSHMLTYTGTLLLKRSALACGSIWIAKNSTSCSRRAHNTWRQVTEQNNICFATTKKKKEANHAKFKIIE